MGVMALFQLRQIVTNSFCLISLEKMNVFDLYFIHRYIIIKYRLIKSKIQKLFLELWPIFNVEK